MKDDLPGLTGLRGLAALAVLGYHHRVPGFGHGWLAVDVFFALSGFVLSHVYRDGVDRGAFLWARFARIAPVYVVTSLMFSALAMQVGAATWADAARGLLLIEVVNPPSWSLQMEVDAYLLFAALAPLPITRRVPGWAILVVGAAVGLSGILFRTGPLDISGQWQMMRGIGWFAAGVGMYAIGWRPRRTWLLDNRVSVWLGEISYPLYLGHYALLVLVGWRHPVLGILASLGLAVALHHGVEVPARRWLRGARLKLASELGDREAA